MLLAEVKQFSFNYLYYDSINGIENEWNNAIPKDLYWHCNYHKSLEKALPNDLKPFYCLIKSENKLVGVIYLQWKRIKLKDHIRYAKKTWWNKIKESVLTIMENNTLVVGNLLLTGKYGFHFKEEIEKENQFNIASDVAENLCCILKKQVSIGTILIKDFFEDQKSERTNFNGFNQFKVQPNMVMKLNPSWSTMEDYVHALKAKSRTRYHRTIHKLEPLTSRWLTDEELDQYRPIMFDLYSNIANTAGFNLFYLNKDYFKTVCSGMRNMRDAFKVKGYFYGEELVAFYTSLENFGHIDAHFLGYNTAYNKEHLVYLNMLFDMINLGIDLKVEKVLMSRTAMEIKSSVGAKPYNMAIYLKHRSKWLNWSVPYFINYFYKNEEWTERNPFKE